ncbi:MAG: hypothetical protein A4E48_02115 [Methanosaeta sp. PtaU1.Bin060]|nr:MAG: hypothetical protein A4E48_02115 [Methanosaeta sp. PtaU1.Bin060]
MNPLHSLLRDACAGCHARRISIVQEYVLEELRRQLVDLHPGVHVLGQDVVGHVDRRISERLYQPLLIPGQPRSETLPPGTGLVLQPVHLVLELDAKLLRDDLHPAQALQHPGLPLRVGIFQEPLVPHHHDHTARSAAADDRRLGKLVEDLCHPLVYQVPQEDILDLGDCNASVATCIGLENSIVKLPSVDQLCCLLRLGIILVLDLQLGCRLYRRILAISGRLNQGDELDLMQIILYAVSGEILVVEVLQSQIIVGRMGRH